MCLCACRRATALIYALVFIDSHPSSAEAGGGGACGFGMQLTELTPRMDVPGKLLLLQYFCDIHRTVPMVTVSMFCCWLLS